LDLLAARAFTQIAQDIQSGKYSKEEITSILQKNKNEDGNK
jgi:hypothetical protein